MNHDAYAGFLKLLLTPTSRLPEGDGDVEAYIRHSNRVDPLSPRTRRMIGQPADRAA
jgi:hypothetical protein